MLQQVSVSFLNIQTRRVLGLLSCDTCEHLQICLIDPRSYIYESFLMFDLVKAAWIFIFQRKDVILISFAFMIFYRLLHNLCVAWDGMQAIVCGCQLQLFECGWCVFECNQSCCMSNVQNICILLKVFNLSVWSKTFITSPRFLHSSSRNCVLLGWYCITFTTWCWRMTNPFLVFSQIIITPLRMRYSPQDEVSFRNLFFVFLH